MASVFRSGNPALSDSVLEKADRTEGTTMTAAGAVNRTLLLFGLLMLTSAFSWYAYTAFPALNGVLWIGGAIGGFVVALVTIFKKTWSPVTAPIYALLEGLFIGGISAMYAAAFEGIVFQAVGLTLGVLLIMLVLYKTGVIVVTKKFAMGVVAATGAVALLYLVSFGMQLLGFGHIGFIHDSGIFGIIFSVVVVVIAALNLVLDFDFFDKGEQAGLPAYMEWYAAFGIMVTLIWLYLEILRLLAKLRRR